MSVQPNSQSEFVTTGGRRSDRRRYEATVQFRSGNKRAAVKVRDISRFGARVGGVFLVRPDDRLYITLPGLAAIEARVAWVTEFEFGCEFLHPLNEIVLDAILARP